MTGPASVRLVLRLPSEDAGLVRYLAERGDGLGVLAKPAAVRAQAAELLAAWALAEGSAWWRVEVERERVENARAAGPEGLARLLDRAPLRSVLWRAGDVRRVERLLRAIGTGAGALAPVAASVAGELAELAAELETAARVLGAEPRRIPER